jgi:hypothetical protein
MAPSLYASRHFVNVVYSTGQVQGDKFRYTLTSVDAARGVERLTRYIHPAVTKLSYNPAIPYWLRRPLAGRFCSQTGVPWLQYRFQPLAQLQAQPRRH